MTTLFEATKSTGVAVFDYLDHDAEVPTITEAACQGDVSIFRTTKPAATTPMPKVVMVVRSEASSNTHTLHPSGECFWEYNRAASVTDLVLGTLTVADGSKALLMHQEHGGIEIGPGTYHVGRQREWAGEWAMVAD
jgi:hypothetical protein